MVEVPINYWVVIVAAVANMAIGFAWFGPLFGKQWMAMMGYTKQTVEAAKAKEDMWKSYILAFVGSLLMAYIVSHVARLSSFYFRTEGIQIGLATGFWLWMGLITPVTLSSVLWESRPWKLWVLNNSYYLVSMLAMGAIIAAWM